MVPWERYQTEAPLLDELEAWWEQTPDANVALVLGRGTFAVDLDGGREAEALLHRHGIHLPPAPMVQTAGGFHVYLSAPGPVPDRVGLLSTDGHKPQVDIRGVGIVVAPPSVHPTGDRYTWALPLAVPFPPAPATLLALIQTRGVPATAGAPGRGGWVQDALAGVGEGQRDATCTRLAGWLLGRGLDPELVILLLRESFGRACAPPFPEIDIRKCVTSIARRDGVRGLVDRAIAPRTLASALDALEAAWAAGPPRAMATPFPGLNYLLTGGFAPGELIYLGARPGVGKTALALECARAVAQAGHAVLVISREMVILALARRLVAQMSHPVSASDLKTGRLGEGDRRILRDTLAQLRRLPIWLTDEAISLGEIAGLVADWTGPPLGLVIVDYLQLVRAPAEIHERRLQVEAVSQGLKTLAVQYGLPVLCLSSLSRPPDGRGTRPGLSSLRESGELEHDADVVILLHRELAATETEVQVAKNRDGRTGTVRLQFQAESVSFAEVSMRQEE